MAVSKLTEVLRALAALRAHEQGTGVFHATAAVYLHEESWAKARVGASMEILVILPEEGLKAVAAAGFHGVTLFGSY